MGCHPNAGFGRMQCESKPDIMMRMRPIAVATLLASALIACSAAENSEPDARTGNGIPDASANGTPDAQRIRPDAQSNPAPDAMPQIDECIGADTEPNNTQLSATSLHNDPITCVDGSGGDVAGSVISGDEDWFTYDSEDNINCQVNPTISIVGNVQVCAYYTCLAGDQQLDLTCPAGDSIASGNNGCCTEGGFEITQSNYNCLGTIDEASTTHFQVTALSTNVCESYTISYNM